MSVESKRIAWGLVGVIVSLILVGVVSATPIRHLIQILPAALALVMVARGAPWASYAALSVFLFWLLIMVLIWLWLLGIANIVNGAFSPAEVVLTFAIGISCVWGLGGMSPCAVYGEPRGPRAYGCTVRGTANRRHVD